jgi:hypothetical protein
VDAANAEERLSELADDLDVCLAIVQSDDTVEYPIEEYIDRCEVAMTALKDYLEDNT